MFRRFLQAVLLFCFLLSGASCQVISTVDEYLKFCYDCDFVIFPESRGRSIMLPSGKKCCVLGACFVNSITCSPGSTLSVCEFLVVEGDLYIHANDVIVYISKGSYLGIQGVLDISRGVKIINWGRMHAKNILYKDEKQIENHGVIECAECQ
jgi:hypothetical protein